MASVLLSSSKKRYFFDLRKKNFFWKRAEETDHRQWILASQSAELHLRNETLGVYHMDKFGSPIQLYLVLVHLAFFYILNHFSRLVIIELLID